MFHIYIHQVVLYNSIHHGPLHYSPVSLYLLGQSNRLVHGSRCADSPCTIICRCQSRFVGSLMLLRRIVCCDLSETQLKKCLLLITSHCSHLLCVDLKMKKCRESDSIWSTFPNLRLQVTGLLGEQKRSYLILQIIGQDLFYPQ